MKKNIVMLALVCSANISAITSSLQYRTISSSPLLYNLKNYTLNESGIETAALFSSLYDTDHVNNNMMLNQKNTLKFDQQGNGDLNPYWLNLMSDNNTPDYTSQVTFVPKLLQGGLSFHGYAESENLYIDVKTALIATSTQVNIEEDGGGNGAVLGIKNATQAFTQAGWNYGKIGNSDTVIGLDNIQVQVGTTINKSRYDMALFGLVEAPTGTGSTAKWLFEPLVGTNHWSLGFGNETVMHCCNDTLNLFVGVNYRYIFSAAETRTFDLTENGQWSRYLLLQPTYGLEDQGPVIDGIPAINFFTQSAQIEGRNQVNLYLSLEKEYKSYLFKFGYNFLYTQAEAINDINEMAPGYGIYTLTNGMGLGGYATSSTASINQATTTPDLTPVDVTSAMLDKTSGASGEILSNRFTTSLIKMHEHYNYGIGANLDIATSDSALSSWAIWLNFEYIFGEK